MASLSRRLADFLGELTFEDLPPQVVDKVKAHTLHKLSTALCGYALPENRKLADMIKREETPKRGGATILVDGSKATRMGAAFANANIMRGFGQTDSYKLVAHPGSTVMPAAFAMAAMRSTIFQLERGPWASTASSPMPVRQWPPIVTARAFIR